MHDPTYQGIPNSSGVHGVSLGEHSDSRNERKAKIDFLFISFWVLDPKLSVRDKERTWDFLSASLISVASVEHRTTILMQF